MINTNKLRGKIVESGFRLKDAAEYLGISTYTLGRKLRNQTRMTLEEADRLRRLLGISKKEAADYFFSFDSCEMQRRKGGKDNV